MTGQWTWQCPLTGTPLPRRTGTRLLECGPIVYPQIDGIPRLQLWSRSASELDGGIRAIRDRGRLGMLDWLTTTPDYQHIALSRLSRVAAGRALPEATFLDDWSACTGTPTAYFLIRWACPSYLCNLALLPFLAGRRVLCLADGVGHLAGLIGALCPDSETVMADCDLLYLLTAKAYLAPKAEAVCAELDDPLPLPDTTFDVVVMNDAFHYIENKGGLLREIFRVLKPGGSLFLVHVHDPRDLTGEVVPGDPITPAECLALIHAIRPDVPVYHALEMDFLRGHLAGRPARSLVQPVKGAMPPGPYLLWVGDGRPPVPDTGIVFSPSDGVRINPIYRPCGEDGLTAAASVCHFEMDWRNDVRNIREFGHTPLPRRITLSRRDLRERGSDLLRTGILVPNCGGALGHVIEGEER